MSDLFTPEFLSDFSTFFSRHYMMCVGWIVVLVLLIAMQFKLLTVRVKKISTNAAVMLINHDNGVFVDVRTPENFKRGHIANSVNITAAEIKEGKVNRIERNRDKPVILVGRDKFDSECFNSANNLKKNGFTQVTILEGGIAEWSNTNLPLTTKD